MSTNMALQFVQTHAAPRLIGVVAGAAVIISLMVGCGIGLDAGLYAVKYDGQSTAIERVEAEIIPSAQIVWEDTRPYWQNGRISFERGAGRLLVLTRITSWDTSATTNQRESGQGLERRDAIFERLWITLPLEAQIGQELDIEKMEHEHLVQYDEKQAHNDLPYYVQPCWSIGKLTVLEEREHSIVIRADIKIRPKNRSNWLIAEKLQVPIVRMGIHATPSKALASMIADEQSETDGALALTDDPELYDRSVSERSIAKGDASSADRPFEDKLPTIDDFNIPESTEPMPGDADTAQVDGGESREITLIGPWIGARGELERRSQFYENGEFVLAERTLSDAGSQASIKYGTYEPRGAYLLLTTNKWIRGKRDMTNQLTRRVESMHFRLKDQVLVLDNIRMRRGNYPDMRYVQPPRVGSRRYNIR